MKYSNIIFTGDTDIDGVTLFAWNGGGTAPSVEIISPTTNDQTVYGSGKQKWFIASPSETYLTPFKWAVTLEGGKTDGAAMVRYKRGNGNETAVEWQGKAQALSFKDGKLPYLVQAIDGDSNAPQMKVEQGVLSISGVEHADLITFEHVDSGAKDSIRLVKNFTWNDLQRGGGKLEFHPDYAVLPKELKDNVIETIKFALDPRKVSEQNKQRLALLAKYGNDPKWKGTLPAVPSALGVGVLPWDFDHGHLASSVMAQPELLQLQLDGFQKFANNEMAKLSIGIDATTYIQPADRLKWVKLRKILMPLHRKLLLESATIKEPLFVFHTYEYCKSLNPPLGDVRRGDPIRSIRSPFGKTPDLLVCPDSPANGNWEGLPNTYFIAHFYFFIDKNRSIVVHPFEGDLAIATTNDMPFKPWTLSIGASLMVNDALGE